MIEELQPYAEYKESGQKWLGRIPAHWDLKPGHAAFAERSVPNRGLKEKTVLSLSYGRIKVKPSDKQHGLVPESYETYQIVDKGNIIIRGTDMQNDHTSLRIGLSRHRGIISSAYLCLEPRKTVIPDYGYQILNTFDVTKAIYRYGSGLRQNLDRGEIKRLPIFLPPLDEQAAIVRFLGHANWKIDGFIRAKRKLIALLGEQKRAIINRAVTRGLNPHAPLKPSGIPGIGDIPRHWEVMQLRQLLSFGPKNGVSPQASEGKGVLSFSISAVRDGRIRIEGNEKLVELDSSRIGGFRIHKGDILLVRGNGNVALVGKCGLVEVCPENCVYPDILMKLRPNDKMVAEFMVLAINSSCVTNQVSTLARTSNGAFKVSGATVRSISMVVPPVSEQTNLVKAVDTETATTNTAIARTEREIALMQEYRTRLTADVVTGKFDVRVAAARLPDLPADPALDPVVDELSEEAEYEQMS